MGPAATDRVLAGANYVLGPRASVEMLQTTDGTGTTAINLTGNGFANTITGNDGDNYLRGQGGIDRLNGRAGEAMELECRDVKGTLMRLIAVLNELHVELVSLETVEPNLERVRGLLKARRDAMLAALERELDGAATWSRPDGGYFVWVDFADDVDAGDLLARATEAGVPFVRGSDFYPGGGGGRSSARLAFSFASPGEIGEGVSRLAALLPARV